MPYLALLRQRNYRRFACSFLVGNVAEGLVLVLVPFLLIARGSSGSLLGVALGAEAAGVLLCVLPAASLADRSSKKRVISFAYGAAAGVLLALFVCLRLDVSVPVAFVGASFLVGCASAFFGPASDALTPRLVDAGSLHTANSFDSLTQTVGSRMVGPLLGGLLLALSDPSLGIAAAAMGYGVAAFAAGTLVEASYTSLSTATETDEDPPHAASWRSAVHYLVRVRLILVLLLWASLNVALQVGGRPTLIPLWIEETGRGSASSYALALAVGAVASVLTSLIIGAVRRPCAYVSVMIAGWTIGPVGMIFVVLWPSTASLVASFALYGAGASLGNVYWSTLLQEQVPDSLRTKIISLDWVASLALVPLGAALFGVLSDVTELAPLLSALALAPVVMTLLIVSVLRERRRTAPSMP
jgi:MFS family permease